MKLAQEIEENRTSLIQKYGKLSEDKSNYIFEPENAELI